MNNLDLFGEHDARREADGELFADAPGLAYALGQLRETMERAERSARLRPGDRHLERKAARARRDYYALRDHRRGMSPDEIAANLAAMERGQLWPAVYDEGGNCRVCGEAGRCPGWHKVPADNVEIFVDTVEKERG